MYSIYTRAGAGGAGALSERAFIILDFVFIIHKTLVFIEGNGFIKIKIKLIFHKKIFSKFERKRVPIIKDLNNII